MPARYPSGRGFGRIRRRLLSLGRARRAGAPRFPHLELDRVERLGPDGRVTLVGGASRERLENDAPSSLHPLWGGERGGVGAWLVTRAMRA